MLEEEFEEYDGEGNVINWVKNKTTPEVVSTDWPIFKVVYDYSDWHLVFFGAEMSDIERLSEKYSPTIIFVDVRVDHQYLREKFNVTETPACVFANKTNKVQWNSSDRQSNQCHRKSLIRSTFVGISFVQRG